MASRGSVIPLFCDQIEAGKQLTITNPEMTRFMMTLEDAVDLVIYAFEHGEQGDLFVQKSPAVTIDTLAKAIKELNSETRFALTGTPVENGLSDLVNALATRIINSMELDEELLIQKRTPTKRLYPNLWSAP